MSVQSEMCQAPTAQDIGCVEKVVISRNMGEPYRSKLIPTTSFKPVNDYNLSQLAFDLYMAVISGYQEAVRNILMSHPDVDVNISVKGATVLSLSLQKRQFHIFSMLIKHQERSKKFDLNKCSKDSFNRVEPPVITACRMHFFEGVVALINNGADIDATDHLGHTALWVAARQQMPDLVEYLIVNGASVNKTDVYHHTPLITAMMYRVSSGIIKMLIMNGSSLEGPRYPANTQLSPLFWSLKYKTLEILKLLIHVGVSNSEIRYVRKILYARNGDPQLIELLDIEAKTPRTLKQICRREIRKHISDVCLGKTFIHKLKDLPIPTVLKQYLALKL
ncbi:GDE1-like protein [Mya arenaria]|uniref:GDE1-like protein n=1 Tax=Mya arenaria TaxID=6604 RepID=A0ABY7DJ65_MYAAR|nr:ankyrin repeat and SOCS box protein 8-like [Mya arenaria]XP_052790712.1 ankyrin repeat and SOCS box protein 8-like [Mya arenaria]WAQ97374.1 GDE1-like protein [Mya arenaria]WAR20707.1 GDE1-like protein [Mya arenaria]